MNIDVRQKVKCGGGDSLEGSKNQNSLSLSLSLQNTTKPLRFNDQIALGTNHVGDFIWVIISDYPFHFLASEADYKLGTLMGVWKKVYVR